MSILDIGTAGWRAFWSSVTAPGAFGVYFIVLMVALLGGFAFNRTRSAFSMGLRVLALLLSAIMIMGVMGVLGLNMNGLTPMINWLLEQVQAPVYIPEA